MNALMLDPGRNGRLLTKIIVVSALILAQCVACSNVAPQLF